MNMNIIGHESFGMIRSWLKITLSTPQRVFAVLAIVFGLLMLIFMPIFMAPDEGSHFARAYEISNGHLISETRDDKTGDYIPTEVNVYIQRDFPQEVGYKGHPPKPYRYYFSHRVNLKRETFIDFRTTAVYSPVSYIPQAIGIGIGRLIYPSIGVMILLGRLCNLAVYILLVYLAIRIARQGKWVYAVLGLFPMSIQAAASLSSDVMTIGLCFTFIALVQRLYMQREEIAKWQSWLLFTLAIGSAVTKQTNVVLLAALLFLPKRVFGSIPRKAKTIGLVYLFSAVAAVTWLLVMHLSHYNMNLSVAQGVNNSLQIHYLLHHPVSFLDSLFRTYVYGGFYAPVNSEFLIVSMYGDFSWLSYTLPLSFILLGFSMLLLALLYRERSEVVNKSALLSYSLTHTGVWLASLVVMAVTLYIEWTPVGNNQIWGLQGRYFIPIVPLLIPLCLWLGRFIKVVLAKPYYIGAIVSAASIINLTLMVDLTYRWFGY